MEKGGKLAPARRTGQRVGQGSERNARVAANSARRRKPRPPRARLPFRRRVGRLGARARHVVAVRPHLPRPHAQRGGRQLRLAIRDRARPHAIPSSRGGPVRGRRGQRDHRRAMLYLLIVELIGAGGFLAVQVAGTVGKTGRILGWAGGSGIHHAQQLDEALRGFYRHQWRRFLVSVGLYFVGWLLGAVQGVLILQSLGLPASLVTATIIEALWSAVRFATFVIPASLGTLEAALAAAFGAFGSAAGTGLAFTP